MSGCSAKMQSTSGPSAISPLVELPVRCADSRLPVTRLFQDHRADPRIQASRGNRAADVTGTPGDQDLHVRTLAEGAAVRSVGRFAVARDPSALDGHVPNAVANLGDGHRLGVSGSRGSLAAGCRSRLRWQGCGAGCAIFSGPMRIVRRAASSTLLAVLDGEWLAALPRAAGRGKAASRARHARV